MKKERGVTLVTLAITITVLIIIASVATYSGIEIINSSQQTKFTAELKIMQVQINSIYQKYKENNPIVINGTTYYGEKEPGTGKLTILQIGQELSGEVQTQANKIFTELVNDGNSGITSTDTTGYRYWNVETIKSLGIEGVEQDCFVNVEKRSVISYKGLKHEGKMYYVLNQLPDNLYNVEYDNPNTGAPTFDVNYEKIGDSKWRINISNIQYAGYINKWKVQYKLEGKNYWNTTEDMSFVVNESGIYYIIIENGNIKSEQKEFLVSSKLLPEGLEIGSTVAYTPSGTYNWQGKYCSISQSDKTLNSAEANFKISEWKVLDITNGKVTLVPTSPTTGTVYLGQAQGYNNGVKLLNDACSSLYGNSAKGITARSMNIDDIEKYMTKEALTSAHEYTSEGVKYGEQVPNPYTSSKNYPVIYAKENLSVINSEPKKEDGLGMSEQTAFIEKTENGATNGIIATAQSIKPYQTNWYKDNTFMQTAFKTATNGINYYNLIMPKGSNTTYWLASRCIGTYSSNCEFDMFCVSNSSVSANYLYDNYFVRDYSLALFPAVSMSFELINGDTTTGFSVP